MNKDATYYEVLISKYLSGEAAPAELAELRDWVGLSDENRILFTRTRKAWALAESVHVETNTDLDGEWAALQSRITWDEGGKLRKLDTHHGKTLMRVAAIALVLIIPSMLYFLFFMSPKTNMLVADEIQVESTLPDGTQVTLNTGSSLQYPGKFKGGERKVALKGEAYFDVAHNKEKPFVIDAEDMQIRVLGTSFYVNTGNEDNNMEVVLLSGSVKLTYAGKEMLLEPGEKAVVLKDFNEIVRQPSDDPNLLAWKTRILRFNDTPLSDIVALLSRVYQHDIRIMNPKIEDCRITATFEKQSLEDVLLVLQSTLNIKVRPNGQTIELSGESCE